MPYASEIACSRRKDHSFERQIQFIRCCSKNISFRSDYYEQKKFVGYVYEEDDVIIGCIFALCKISGSKKEIYINEMAVLPERQGQGIGTQLNGQMTDGINGVKV